MLSNENGWLLVVGGLVLTGALTTAVGCDVLGSCNRPADDSARHASSESRQPASKCLPNAVGVVRHVSRRLHAWRREPTSDPPELPALEKMPRNAESLRHDTLSVADRMGRSDLVLGPSVVQFDGRTVYERERSGAYSQNEVEAVAEAMEKKWSDAHAALEQRLKATTDEPDATPTLYVFAHPEFELAALRTILNPSGQKFDVRVVGTWKGAKAATNSERAPNAAGADAAIDGAAGACDALQNAARVTLSSATPDPDELDMDPDGHPEIRDLFGKPFDALDGRQLGLAQFLVALRNCGCGGVDLAALERAWTRRMLPPARDVWATGLSEEALANGDRTIGEWLASLPSAASPKKAGAADCIAEAVEIQAWFGYTKVWHRPENVPFDLPRASGDLERFEELNSSPKLVFGSSGVRLDGERFAEDMADTDQSAKLADALARQLKRKKELHEVRGKRPVEKLTVDVYAAPDVSVEKLEAWLGAINASARARLIVADESHPPPASARPDIEWIDERLSTLRGARSYEKRREILHPAIVRIAGECEPVARWLAFILLDPPPAFKQPMLPDMSLARHVAGCDCAEFDLRALRALLLGARGAFQPEPASVPLDAEALRRTDAETVQQVAKKLAAPSDAGG